MKKKHTPNLQSQPPVADAQTTNPPQNLSPDENPGGKPKADLSKIAAMLSMMPVTQDERLQRKQDRFDEQNR